MQDVSEKAERDHSKTFKYKPFPILRKWGAIDFDLNAEPPTINPKKKKKPVEKNKY